MIALGTATKVSSIADAAPAPPRAPFLDRLPPASADRLVALAMEDHYVRAHGPDASALILLRMRDAEAELDRVAARRGLDLVTTRMKTAPQNISAAC